LREVGESRAALDGELAAPRLLDDAQNRQFRRGAIRLELVDEVDPALLI
jgi:hypothetical protein